MPNDLSAERNAARPAWSFQARYRRPEIFLRQRLRRLQPDRLQRPQGNLRIIEDHRSAPRNDQRTCADRDAERKSDRAGNGDAAPGRIAQYFRRRHDDRGSAEVYLRKNTKFQTPITTEISNIKLQERARRDCV